MKSFEEIHDVLFKEHEANYEYFTRFILTLSVGFVTFTTAQLSNDPGSSGALYKIGLTLHGLSLLFGIWLQYVLLKKPLKDLEKVADIFEKSDKIKQEKGEYFSRPPSKLQQVCFNIQIGSFIIAFLFVIANILII